MRLKKSDGVCGTPGPSYEFPPVCAKAPACADSIIGGDAASVRVLSCFMVMHSTKYSGTTLRRLIWILLNITPRYQTVGNSGDEYLSP